MIHLFDYTNNNSLSKVSPFGIKNSEINLPHKIHVQISTILTLLILNPNLQRLISLFRAINLLSFLTTYLCLSSNGIKFDL